MNCTDVQPVVGCRRNAAGAVIGSVVIHYQYAPSATAGGVQIHKTRYTDAAGVPIALAVGDTVAAGACPISVPLAAIPLRRTGLAPFVIAAGYKAISVTSISANVTIDGQLIPAGFSWPIGSAENERYTDTHTIAGTDYFVTVSR